MSDDVSYARVEKRSAGGRICAAIAWLLTVLSLLAALLAASHKVQMASRPMQPDDWGGEIFIALLLLFSVLVGGGAALFSFGMRPSRGRRFVQRYAAVNAAIWVVVFLVLLALDISSRPAVTVLHVPPKQSPAPTSMPVPARESLGDTR